MTPHLRYLESEAIQIIRESVACFKNPAMLIDFKSTRNSLRLYLFASCKTYIYSELATVMEYEKVMHHIINRISWMKRKELKTSLQLLCSNFLWFLGVKNE